MFRESTIAVINKVDLAEYVGCNVNRLESDIHRYNPEMPVFRTNMRTGDGMEELLDEILK
jgi:hydrogenase nickel incorporation protein HypB